MPLQAPELLTSEGRSTDALQIGGRPSGKGTVLDVDATTDRIILPVGANGLPYAAYSLQNDGSATVYYAFGDVTVTVDHVATDFDGAILAGTGEAIKNSGAATYIAAITVSGTGNLIIAPYI